MEVLIRLMESLGQGQEVEGDQFQGTESIMINVIKTKYIYINIFTLWGEINHQLFPQATYQAFSAPAVNPVQPSSQQPPYNNYHFGRVSSRASWDGNSTSKKGTQGTQ